MAKVMGTVKSIIGEATATAPDGTVRKLQVGDQVFTDDVISTSATGSVQIALAGGQTLECGNDTSIAMNDYVIGSGVNVALAATPVTPPAATDVASLQAAIAAGADPSQVAEATAAGGAPGAGGGAEGGGGRSIVVLEQGDASQVVNAGFSTEGAGIGFPTPEVDILPDVESPPVVSVGVEVEVEIDPENPPPDGSGGIINVSGNTVDVLEGTDSGATTPVTFNIVLSAASEEDVQVTYTIMAGTAGVPEDFTAVMTDTVTIPAGQTSFPVTVFIEQDHLVEGTETFNIVLSDAVGAVINPDADTVFVNIIDDDARPLVNDDSNWVQEDGEKQVAEGNVLESQAHAGDPSASLSFADAADTDTNPDEVLTVTTVDGSAGNVGASIAGAYGTLVLNADGSYTYTLNSDLAEIQALDTGETLSESFSYTITDGFNGNSEAATLTITVFGSNDVPTIEVKVDDPQDPNAPYAESAAGTVFESGLSTGSASGADSEFLSGSFRLADVDGADDIDSVTINGDTVAIDELVGHVFDGAAGTLTITSFAGGIAQFTYELTGPVTDGEGLEQDVFTLTTSDGTSTSAPATVTVTIVDDVPLAVNDSNSLTEDTVSVSGNVRANDTQGADRTATVSGGTIEGEYGTLVLSANGSYTYTLNNSAVQGLDVGETLQEVFPYTLTDADGDPSPANLTITITGSNDAPVLQADTNWVVEDHEVNSVATGNVLEDITHSGAPSGEFADMADSDVDGENLTVTAGEFVGDYGTLVLNADGSYTYTLDNSNEDVQLLGEGQTLTDSFSYTASDGTANVNSTLTITIFGTNDGPSLGQASATVSEEGLEAGIPDNTGSNDTTNSATASGQIEISDSDGDPVAVTLTAPPGTLTSGGETIQWSGSGTQTLVGSIDGGETTIITITIDNDGNYEVTLEGPIDHPANPAEDQLSFGVGVRADDGEAVSTGTLVVTVEDDRPVVTASAVAADALQVDETDLETDATENLAGLFDVEFGADGEGSVTYALGISAAGADSGLVDSATGEAVLLFMNEGVVVGRTTGGEDVFTVSVDEDGNVTLDQLRAVMHGNTSSDNEETSLGAANLVRLTATATDADGDSRSATVNLGNAISFRDDGPSIEVADVQTPSLTVDETLLGTDATADFSGVFSAQFGADGEGDVTYALEILGGDGTDSGIVDTATGDAVTLHSVSAGVVEGRNDDGDVVFRVTVNADGEVELDQLRAVIHNEGTSPDQSDPVSVDSGVLNLVGAVTDADGDSDDASIDLGGLLTFLDDGPSIDITAGATSVVEGGTVNNGTWTVDEGADGGVVKVVFEGDEYDLDEAIDTGTGTLTVNADFTWTFVADSNLDNPSGVNMSFQVKITDADGDFATDSHTISITDGAGPEGGGDVTLLPVNEDDLPAGSDTSKEDLFSSDVLDFTAGSDDIVSFAFGSTEGIVIEGVDEGVEIDWDVSDDGLTLTGQIDGVDVIKVELSGTLPIEAGEEGSVTVTATLLAEFPHGSDPEDKDSLTISGISVLASDTDGDTASGTASITVLDDEVVVTATGGTIENDVGETLTGLLPYDMNADGLGTLTLANPIVTSNDQPLALTSNGHAVVYQLTDENGDGVQDLKAYADVDGNGFDEGDTLVFTLAATGGAEGSYTLTMHDVVDLPVPTITLTFDGIEAGGPTDEINVGGVLLISTVDPVADNLNASSDFIGIQNNVMNNGETIRYEFGTVTGTTNNYDVDHELVNDVQLIIFDTGNGTDSFSWTAFKDGAQVGTGSLAFELDSGSLTDPIHVDGGYDTLVFDVTGGAFKVGGVVYNELGDAQDVNLNIGFTGTDADGDATSGSIDVTITAGDGAVDQAVQTLLNQDNI